MTPFGLTLWVVLILLGVGWLLMRLPKRTEVEYDDVTLVATMSQGVLEVILHYRGSRASYAFRSPRQFEVEARYVGLIKGEVCPEIMVMISGLKARVGLACRAAQESDAMHCKQCNLVWDAGDPLPPHCAKVVGHV